MTFDEYWNDPDRARAGVGLYTHQIARAAYEAGAQEEAELKQAWKDKAISLRARVGSLEAVLTDAQRLLSEGKASCQMRRKVDIAAFIENVQEFFLALPTVLPEPKAPEPVRTRPPAPASEPKTSAAAGVDPPPAGTLLACGHVMGDGLCREHCRYPSEAAPYEPVMCSCGREFATPQALWDHYVKDAPREPCCDLASRGTHRKGCTGEPMSKQIADLTSKEPKP